MWNRLIIRVLADYRMSYVGDFFGLIGNVAEVIPRCFIKIANLIYALHLGALYKRDQNERS